MPKFYVESGPIRLIFDAPTAEQAAVMAFQWTCDKQVEIEAASPLDHVLEAEVRGWQLCDEVTVNKASAGGTARCSRRGTSSTLGSDRHCCWSEPHGHQTATPTLLLDAS